MCFYLKSKVNSVIDTHFPCMRFRRHTINYKDCRELSESLVVQS